MRASLTRAGGYAGVSLLAITALAFDGFALAVFALVAIASSVIDRGPLFELFADPAERRVGRLVGLTEFTAIAAVVAAGSVLNVVSVRLFVGIVLLSGGGYLGAELAKGKRSDRLTETIGFVVGGFIGFCVGYWLGSTGTSVALEAITFFGFAGSLTAALIRAATWSRHDGLIMLVVLGLLSLISTSAVPSIELVAVALATSAVLGYLALMIDAASVPGAITGVLTVYLTVVLGGIAWVVLLVAFFGIGGLATKYRFDEKRRRGVAERNRGARGTGNVLGNTAVALIAVLAFANASSDGIWDTVYLFAFAGAMATALSDTLSSEIGGLYDDPWLITSLDRVSPGTDGAVTVQGTLAGIVGAVVIATLAVVLSTEIRPSGGGLIVLAGVVGMFTDSVLGAVLEGRLVGNHAVNALATLTGAVIGGCAPAIGLG